MDEALLDDLGVLEDREVWDLVVNFIVVKPLTDDFVVAWLLMDDLVVD